jgi:hypothetical protein
MLRERSSVLNKTAEKILRADFLLLNDDTEVGCGEIKCQGTSEKLQENDRARIAETLKRQLHQRIMKARDIKEFKTFGIFIQGFKMELYTLTFDANEGYQLYQLDTLDLPSSKETYNSLDETLELIASFKVRYTIIRRTLSFDSFQL